MVRHRVSVLFLLVLPSIIDFEPISLLGDGLDEVVLLRECHVDGDKAIFAFNRFAGDGLGFLPWLLRDGQLAEGCSILRDWVNICGVKNAYLMYTYRVSCHNIGYLNNALDLLPRLHSLDDLGKLLGVWNLSRSIVVVGYHVPIHVQVTLGGGSHPGKGCR